MKRTMWVAPAALCAATLMGAGGVVPVAQASAYAVPACTSDDMAVGYHATDAGAGHRYGVIRITNISDHACRTGGYGGLSYVGDGDGTQIGAAADRDPGRVRRFTVQPGQRLVSPVDAVVAQNYPRRKCRPAHVDGFRVYLPDETRSQYVAHPTTGCRNPHVHLLDHQPYRRP